MKPRLPPASLTLVSAREYRLIFSDEEKKEFLQRVEALEKGNFIVRDTDHLYLTPRALAVENEVAVKLSL